MFFTSNVLLQCYEMVTKYYIQAIEWCITYKNYQIALLRTGYYTKVSNNLANFNGKKFNTNYIKLSNKLKLSLLQKFVYWS